MNSATEMIECFRSDKYYLLGVLLIEHFFYQCNLYIPNTRSDAKNDLYCLTNMTHCMKTVYLLGLILGLKLGLSLFQTNKTKLGDPSRF